MRRNSFFDEFGSIIKYTVIALMVIILFFVCFAFSRKDEQTGGTEETTTAAADETTTAGVPEETMPEETTPEETTPEATQAPATITAEDGTVFMIVNETLYAQDGLNVREQPSTSGTKIGVLDSGTAVTRIGISETGWSMIEYNGANAFVSSEFLGATTP